MQLSSEPGHNPDPPEPPRAYIMVVVLLVVVLLVVLLVVVVKSSHLLQKSLHFLVLHFLKKYKILLKSIMKI